jgi:hypothetical protein
MVTNSDYSDKIIKFYIYNTPATFSSISKILMPLVDPIVKKKIVLYDKNDSSGLLKTLFEIKN